MGYYTDYMLRATDADDEAYDKYAKALQALNRGFNPLSEACTWYEHENHMLALSREYPDVTFRLDGEGEETGDIWVKWFKDGKTKAWHLEISPPEGFVPPGGWT